LIDTSQIPGDLTPSLVATGFAADIEGATFYGQGAFVDSAGIWLGGATAVTVLAPGA